MFNCNSLGSLYTTEIIAACRAKIHVVAPNQRVWIILRIVVFEGNEEV